MMRIMLLIGLMLLSGCTAVVDKVVGNALDGQVATLTGIVKDDSGNKLCRYQNGLVTLYRPRVGICDIEIQLTEEELNAND